MRFYGIDFVAHELDVHSSSLRRWEENGLISPERATMGKTTLRIYDEKTMRLLRHAKTLMDSGMTGLKHSLRPATGSGGRDRAMIDMESIRRLNNCETNYKIRVLELNEERIYAWVVLDSPTVARENLDRSFEYVSTLRELIEADRLDYVNPSEALLPFWCTGLLALHSNSPDVLPIPLQNPVRTASTSKNFLIDQERPRAERTAVRNSPSPVLSGPLPFPGFRAGTQTISRHATGVPSRSVILPA
jgi:MerR family transcriptional regulator, heat shock protein HspR